jgi:serine/threonine protein kinase
MFWADQLLDALNYLHSQEPPVIHRDIKPQNLKLTDENSVVLLDFGLSKNTIAETFSLTSTSSVVGYTPHFAPMEQIRGMGTNARSDIYSLSATLYQLLTNVVPPETLIRAEDLLAGKPDPIKPVNEINPEVSIAVSDIILKGMEVSQEKRFSDAREMQKALRAAYTQTQDRDAKEIAAFTAQASGNVSGVSQAELKTNVSFTPSINESRSNGFAEGNSKQIKEAFPQANSSPAMNLPPEMPPAKAKSNNMFFTIVGFGAPLVIAAAIGIGWFMMRDSKAVKSENSFPTPEAVVIASPTAEPTLETVADSISNENENASNENSFDSNSNVENDVQNSNARTQNPIDKTPKSTPQAIVKTTPKAPAPPTTRSTPKSTAPSKTPKATPLPRILP